jgi:hypothetical protein
MERLAQYHEEVNRLVFLLVDKGDDWDYRTRVLRFLEAAIARSVGPHATLALSGSFPLRMHLLESDLDVVLLARPPAQHAVFNTVDGDLALTLQVFQGICSEIAQNPNSSSGGGGGGGGGGGRRLRRGSGSGYSSTGSNDGSRERGLGLDSSCSVASGSPSPSPAPLDFTFPIKNVTFVNGRTKVRGRLVA